MERMNILVLQPDFSNYTSAYYQHEFTEALSRAHRVFRYGPGFDGYRLEHRIEDVLGMCPFDPDLICFAAGWENEDEQVVQYDPHPTIRVDQIGIPSVMILNKEYKKLEKKFQFIRENRIRKVFTVHHDYRRWQDDIGVPFVHFPFAVNQTVFRDRGERRKYELGFSGLLQNRYSDVRTRVKGKLFWSWPIKAPRYWTVRIFWSSGRRLAYVNRTLVDYARLLGKSKIWLSTPSPAGLVGTRYYEVMATRTLLFCSRSEAYQGLFEDGVHCVMFEPDLSDFDELLFYYLRNDAVRERVLDAAYAHVLENHTWERRVEQFTDEVREIC